MAKLGTAKESGKTLDRAAGESGEKTGICCRINSRLKIASAVLWR